MGLPGEAGGQEVFLRDVVGLAVDVDDDSWVVLVVLVGLVDVLVEALVHAEDVVVAAAGELVAAGGVLGGRGEGDSPGRSME